MSPEKPINFESTIDEIEKITSRLNAGGNLDAMVEDYKRAVRLINDCRSYLKQAESQIAEISKKQD